MRILITGLTGFAGTYLAEHLVEHHRRSAEIWGLVRWASSRAELRPIEPMLQLVPGDLADGASIVRALRASRPEVIFHLAAASTVSSSWSTPSEVLQTNVVGSANLFEAIRSLDLDPLVIVASSAEAYGRVRPDETPVKESQPFRPVSPYGVSKAAVDLMAAQYHAAWSLRTIRLRLFNHTGPRRPDRFAASSFARQIAEIERGLAEPVLRVGDLTVVRDLSDVRDIARAYWLAALRGEPGGVYNVCSGQGVRLQTIVDRLLSFSEVHIALQADPGRLRAADIPVLVGDPARFAAATGWRPAIPLDQTLHDLLEWWRRDRAGA